MENKKKVLLIVNPCAGKNKSRIGTLDVVERLSSSEYDFTVKTTACAGDATNLVKKFIDGNDMVICCGGDGTLNETINGIMSLERRVPVGYIPTGSTNDLASTIGIPSNVKEATDMIMDGHVNGYDIGLFNNRYFSYVASFGPGTAMSYETPQKMKNLLGHGAYLLNGFVLNIIPLLKQVKPRHMRFEYDGGVIEDDFFFGAFSNSTSVGGVFKYNRDDVKLDDGLFEVLLVRKLRNAADAFLMFKKIQKRDYDGDTLLYFKTSRARITFDKPEKWTLDGEYGGEFSDVNLAVLPKAIDIFSPENPMFIGGVPQPVFVREEPSKNEPKEKKLSRRAKKAEQAEVCADAADIEDADLPDEEAVIEEKETATLQ